MSTVESDLAAPENGSGTSGTTENEVPQSGAASEETKDECKSSACLAQAQVTMPWLDFNARLHVMGRDKKKEEPKQKAQGGFRLPGLTVKKKEKKKADEAPKDLPPKNGSTDDWHDLTIPKKKQLWNGFEGMAATIAGIALPSLLILMTCASLPKRLTLVLLNHPVESLVELALIVGIPLANYIVWSSLCKNNLRFSLFRGITLGSAIGTSLMLAVICVAAIFAGTDLQSELGTDFGSGFSWMALLSLLTGAVSIYLANRVRLTRDFKKSRAQIVVFTVIGAVMSVFAFLTAEARPWYIRLAEQKAVSNVASERQEGMSILRSLNPEREFLMECSDPRAAGLCGLFIPLKASAQHQLYFELTGKPFSFKDIANEDLSSMPDDYLSRHVVGDKIKGLSMTRSYLTGVLHPNTFSSTVEWTFVFKNQGQGDQEARAEVGLPPGAVITGLTVWNKGEPQDAGFAASGKAEQFSSSSTGVGHDSPAIVTDLGHGRMLLHCYPVTEDEELKVRLTMVMPLKPDGSTSSTLSFPKLIATNFDLEGEHLIRLRSTRALGSTAKSLTPGTNPDGTKAIYGTLSKEQMESANLLVTAQRDQFAKPVVVLDKLAIKLRQEEEKRIEELKRKKHHVAKPKANNDQLIVMLDGSRGVQRQIEELNRVFRQRQGSGPKANAKAVKPKIKTIKPEYVIENVSKIAAPAPKNLLVVVDGSSTMKEYKGQVVDALKRIPRGVATTLIVASKEQDKSPQALSLDAGIARLDKGDFVGGQDNLKSVVKAAELAGETKGGVVLWIHGPQPSLNEEIYIMPQYVAAPTFYEMPVGAGETDTYDYFKNHTEIGPFSQVPRSSNSVSEDLGSFFSKWRVDENGYAVDLQQKKERPADSLVATADESRELLALHANQEVAKLLLNRHVRRASRVAVSYGLVTPVSCALVDENLNKEVDTDDAQVNQSGSENNNDNERGVNENGESSNGQEAEAQDANNAPDASNAQDSSNGQDSSSAPELQSATNGTIGPQGGDASYVVGVNTAGTVRVNNLANLEAMLNIIANLAETGFALIGAIIVLHSLVNKSVAIEMMGQEFELGQGQRIALGVGLVLIGLVFPGLINWFVASARDANLFS